MTSVEVACGANLRPGRPTVKENMSVPKITAVLIRPARDAGHIDGSLSVRLSYSRGPNLLEHFE